MDEVTFRDKAQKVQDDRNDNGRNDSPDIGRDKEFKQIGPGNKVNQCRSTHEIVDQLDDGDGQHDETDGANIPCAKVMRVQHHDQQGDDGSDQAGSDGSEDLFEHESGCWMLDTGCLNFDF